jgi:hypothetical protein
MSKSIIAILILTFNLSAFAGDFCAWKKSQKLSDICTMIKEKMKFKECDQVWTGISSQRTVELNNLRSVKNGLVTLGYDINEAEYSKLERFFMRISGDEVSYKLRRLKRKLFDPQRACANQTKLMNFFNKKIVR